MMGNNDLTWYLFARRNRRALRRLTIPLLIILVLAATVYATLRVSTVLERLHYLHVR